MSYNGYTNKPTWLFMLWMSNEEATDEDLHTLARAAEGDVHMLAHMLEEYLQDLIDMQLGIYAGHGMLSDLLSYATGIIDWTEVAEHVAADYGDDDDDDDE